MFNYLLSIKELSLRNGLGMRKTIPSTLYQRYGLDMPRNDRNDTAVNYLPASVNNPLFLFRALNNVFLRGSGLIDYVLADTLSTLKCSFLNV